MNCSVSTILFIIFCVDGLRSMQFFLLDKYFIAPFSTLAVCANMGPFSPKYSIKEIKEELIKIKEATNNSSQFKHLKQIIKDFEKTEKQNSFSSESKRLISNLFNITLEMLKS